MGPAPGGFLSADFEVPVRRLKKVGHHPTNPISKLVYILRESTRLREKYCWGVVTGCFCLAMLVMLAGKRQERLCGQAPV